MKANYCTIFHPLNIDFFDGEMSTAAGVLLEDRMSGGFGSKGNLLFV
jgi:hypothetical protein